MHSVLHPVSPQAQLVSTLWWWMLGVAALVYLLVAVAMLAAAARARRETARPPALGDRTAVRWVGATAAATMCVGAAFFVYSIRVGTEIGQPPAHSLAIDVVGHQWWWEASYDDPDPHNRFATANEIHIPVGQQVAIALRSSDVIHSFWVPNIAGKRDLIPGHPQRIWIQADSPGVYRGQCSQFCGLQHAHMAFLVVAEPRERFEAWARQQRSAAEAPADSMRALGRNVFDAAGCRNCHTIGGTTAIGSLGGGPNLTHLASRSTIAAGTLTNSRDHLGAWILDPHSFKPGVGMPANPLNRADLDALTAYLGGLK